MSLIGYWRFVDAPQTNLVADQAGNMDITHGGGGGVGWWRDSPDYALAGENSSWQFTADLANRPDPTLHTGLSFCFGIKAGAADTATSIFSFYGSPAGGYKGWGLALNMNAGSISCIDSAALWNGTSWQTFPNTGNVFPSVADQRSRYYGVSLNITQGGNAEAFIDGQSLGTVATGTLQHDTTVGGQPWGQDYSYIDNIQYHDRVLTATEIAAHAANPRDWTESVGLGDEQLWLCPTITGSPYDISGNGNTALIAGTVPVVEDTTGYESFQTDNTTLGTDYVYFDSPTGTTDPAAATIAFWAKSNFSGSYSPIAGFCTAGFNDLRFFIQRKATTGEARVARKTTSSGVTVDDFVMPNGTPDFTDGNMHHWCLVFEGGKNKLYFDGAFIGESATALSDNLDLGSTNFSLGSQDGRTTSASASNYDDIRFYDSALTQAEITHLASSRGVEGPPPVGLGDEQIWLCPSIANTAFDISGNGNNGTYQGGMGTVADTSNGGSLAYSFDGVDDYIDTGSTTVHSNTVFSYSLWLKIASTNAQEGVMGSYDHTTNDRGPALALESGVSHGEFYYQSNGSPFNSAEVLESSQDIFDNTWRHVVCMFDGDNNTAKIYRDGVLSGETSSGVPNSVNISTSFKVGAGLAQYVAGLVDDVRVYNRELTQAEIVHLAEARGIEGPPPVGLGDEKIWLCPSINDSANDISGNGNNGIYGGGMGTVADTSNGGTMAYSFDGVDDGVQFYDNGVGGGGGAADFLSDGTFSVSLWYQTSIADTGLAGYPMWGTRERGGYYGYNGGMKPTINNGRWQYIMSERNNFAGVSDGYNPPSPNDTSWHHVCWSSTAGVAGLYIDGVLVDTLNVGNTISGQTSLYLGKAGNWTYANGLMDDVRMYDRTLTQAEITHLATSRGIEGSPSGPPSSVFYNPFKSQAFHSLIGKRIR